MARVANKVGTDVAPPARKARWVVDDYLSYLLARASHAVAAGFHREVRAAGLTVLEWRVLSTLANGDAFSVGELASIALAQQSTVTKLLMRMEREGRVARRRGRPASVDGADHRGRSWRARHAADAVEAPRALGRRAARGRGPGVVEGRVAQVDRERLGAMPR